VSTGDTVTDQLPADAPIGVFDSGVGGLTVLRSLLAQMPRERFIYLGDTARLPYGTKSAATVVRYALQAAELFRRETVKCLVVACNTAASVGLAPLRERFAPLPVIGVIEPGAQAACGASVCGRIAVIATERTVREGAYQTSILRLRPQAQVTVRAAPLLVGIAEEGLGEGAIAELAAHHYLDELFQGASPPDTLLLGCTHFPMLAGAIRTAVPAGTVIVDSAVTTAHAVHEQLTALRLVRRAGAGEIRFFATDGAERFARIGSRFLERLITPTAVGIVDL
jgi:glutamate racemase